MLPRICHNLNNYDKNTLLIPDEKVMKFPSKIAHQKSLVGHNVV